MRLTFVSLYYWPDEGAVPRLLTGRPQTVSKRQNPRYWALIKAFDDLTGVPVVLNTSFNENEPIVNTPEEALACFLRTRMDRLAMGNWGITRPPSA